jgi:SpoVK/Ycf46/Vps4 family AAA+-type ATPase
MTVRRVTSRLNLRSGDRFFVLYGANTSDTFCTADLCLPDIEQILHEYLRSEGYQRILFYNGVQKLYFLDERSRDRCRLQPNTSSNSAANQPMKVSSGPLGHKRGLLGKKAAQTSATPTPLSSPTPSSRQLQDVQILPILETAMQDTQQKSAIIFSNAEDLENFENRRELFGRMVNWSRLPPTNTNLCLFIFHHENGVDLRAFCDRINLTLLANSIGNREESSRQHCNFYRVSAPEVEEIQALRDYFRLEHRKPVDWKVTDKLLEWIAVENRSLKYWFDRFDSASQISLEKARQQGWFSGDVSTQPALERLNQMIGLASVKENIRRRMQSLAVEKERRKQGMINNPPRLHLVFKGNPGTGKTTVARLVGEIYRDLGLLRRGHIKEVSRQDLVAGYVGQTAIRTNEAIDEAIDGVLFIDEAYTLIQGENGNFGQEAIDTLLKRMEDERHRLAVIITGYPDNIDEFINSNPGLSRRFATEIIFEDYNGSELLEIFKQQVARVQCSIAPELETALNHLFSQLYDRRDRNFGNAGLIENLFNQIDEQRSQRVIEQNLNFLNEPFQAIDLPAQYRQESRRDEETLESLLQELDSIVGLHSVKKAVREAIEAQKANQQLREAGIQTDNEIETRHMLFTGNPGTGKTTVARLIGKILRALGMLKKGHFIEVDRQNLVGLHVGETTQKTAQILEEALDGVLFIDEAYQLSRSESGIDYGKEAIDILVPRLDNDRDRLAVIFAGYSREMEQFIDVNSGIASRIAYKIEFPDYNATELYQIFERFCHQSWQIISPEVATQLQELFAMIYRQRDRNFGNGREVRNVYEQMVRRLKSRIVRDNLTGDEMKMFALEDIPTRSLEN